MKILLVGEYSRLHNSLKEGLESFGHEVIIISTGDGFKDYPSDIKIQRYFQKGILSKVKNFIYVLTKFDCASYTTYLQVKSKLKEHESFDIVQFINEISLLTSIKHSKKIFRLIQKKTSKIYLLACGIDYVSVKYAYEDNFKYSILTGLDSKKSRNLLRVISLKRKELYHFYLQNINGIISSDLDYHLPYQNTKKYLGLIPNPVNISSLEYQQNKIKDKIIIFHGVNKQSYQRKGNRFFDEALNLVKQKYTNKVEVIHTENIPYEQYIALVKQCNILLDQVFAYDQGYNALEAMAMGKVVFTGAEDVWLEHYNLQEDSVAINALPDADFIFMKLEKLILNPDLIMDIGENANQFIKNTHDYKKIANAYLNTWI